MNKKKVGILAGVAAVAIAGVILSSKLGLMGAKDTISDASIKVSHKYGEIEVPFNPEKIVVLNYAALDILDEMDLEDRVVGTAQVGLPSYLKEYTSNTITDVGNLKEFSLETVNELNPDLIIMEGRQESYYEELSKIAPTLYLANDNAEVMGTLENNIKTLGTIFGKEDETQEMIAGLQSRITALNNKIKDGGFNAIAMMVTDGSMSVYGNGSRFNFLFNELGFEAADENIEVSNHGQTVSYEYLVDKNPNYLFVIDKNYGTGASDEPVAAMDILNNEIVNSTDTAKNEKIVYLNAPAWYVGGAGIQAIDFMVADIENLFE